MVDQGLKRIDRFARDFSLDIDRLVQYKVNGDEENYKFLFEQMQRRLFKRRRYAEDQDLWVELYKQSLYLYPRTREIVGIPCTLVTKHNEILRFYMEQHIHKSSATILRFDTHADLNPIKDSALLPDLYEQYLQTNNTHAIDKA